MATLMELGSSSGCLNFNRLKIQRISSLVSVHPRKFYDALQECADTRDIKRGLQFHCQVIKLVGTGWLSLWNKLLNVYSRCGLMTYSFRVFNSMSERDIVSFNTVISGYTQRGLFSEALVVYSQIRTSGMVPNSISLSTMLKACASVTAIERIQQVHAEGLKCGLNLDKFVMSSLVDCYFKCKRLDEARVAFDEIDLLDIVSWNIMLAGYASNDCHEQALETFMHMLQSGMSCDSFTMTSILGACVQPNHLKLGKQLHAFAVKAGLASETPIGNALITMYSKCRDMNCASQLFFRIYSANIISYTALIAGFIENGMNEDAVLFYHHMLDQGVKENEYTFASILKSFSSLSSLQQGRQVHARIVKSGFESDLLVENALIDAYSKCGSIMDAQNVFVSMINHDKVSYTTMIGGLAQHGMGKEAVELFEAMKVKGLHADDVTYLSILSACSHSGLVDKGLQIFQSMSKLHSVKPRREHYACIVDMLGRSGRLEEAEKFIKNVSVESDAYVWEALLGACRIHGDMELGIRSAKKAVELGQEKDGVHVLLSSIYAEKGMWEEKSKVRRKLEGNALRKEPGSSWLEV
ncbi:Pentatricopeptide repeat-containing protein [Nymphaea thermarum]|nr:Pentatricopeptide repeat-containing protein [Nymphaea thermarum]